MEPPQYIGDLWAFKTETILPIQVPEKHEEKARFDDHSAGFWAFKNATKMAEIEASAMALFTATGTAAIPSQLNKTAY